MIRFLLYIFFLFSLVLLKHSSTWSVVSLLTLVCQTVYEVQDILHCSIRSSCLVHDILECFYCLASIFYHLGSQNRIDSGYVCAFEIVCRNLSFFHSFLLNSNTFLCGSSRSLLLLVLVTFGFL